MKYLLLQNMAKFLGVAFTSLFFAQIATAQEQSTGLQREVWTEVSGGGLWHLKKSDKFYQEPDRVEVIEGALAPPNEADDYGQRLRGYLQPAITGNYVFWIASDENSELSLSTDESKFNKTPVAMIRGLGTGAAQDSAKPLEWGKFLTQKSKPIRLEAGKRYFIEALHKEGHGDDHLAIGWSSPDGKPEVIPSKYLSPYQGEAADLDRDDLPDAWETLNRFSISDRGLEVKENGPLGDPDGDGWLNWEECQNGSDPRKAEVQQGTLQCEIWFGVMGKTMDDLHRNWRFFFPADQRTLVKGLKVSEARGADQYGMRLRGYITPEVSGTYNFLINGDDNCEFWISSSESKFEVERLAWVSATDEKKGFAEKDEWDKFPSQKSRLIELKAGKRYFIEVLQKEGWYEGRVEVQWMLPGAEQMSEIPSQLISSYLPTAEDPDDDNLPTEWEVRYGMDPLKNGYDDGPMADPDNDLIPNWIEYRAGMDPTEPNSREGAFNQDVWWDLRGSRIVDLVDSDKFFEGPDWSSLKDGDFVSRGKGDNYGVRLRARLAAPVSGTYRFWIAGDNHCDLWLSSDSQKFNKRRIAYIEGQGTGHVGDFVSAQQWDTFVSQRSQGIFLAEGEEYFIEVLLKEGIDRDHVAVAWQVPGEERALMTSKHLTSYMITARDLDDDYLPDEWEEKFGLDRLDNGLSDRSKEGERGDFDGDGLTNHREYLSGTNPAKADTDGDGINDYDELEIYGSSPTKKDASPPRLIQNFDLKSSIDSLAWMKGRDGSITSVTRRGNVNLEFQLDQPGIYLVEFQGETVGFKDYVPEISVACLVDGLRVGDTKVSRSGTTRRWATQWLSAGAHQVTIQNNNVSADSLLKINSVNLYRQEGEDLNENGIPDWMENFYQSNNSVFANTTESLTSPLCLEGSARFVDLMSINGNRDLVRSGIDNQWYANIPLNAGGGTPLKVQFDDSSHTKEVTLQWLETDLFALGLEPLKVRLGDSLKVGAGASHPDGLEISLNGVILGQAQAGKPIIATFKEAGVQKLTASSIAGSLAEVVVIVYDVDFGEKFSVAGGFRRIWEQPGLEENLLLESDSELQVDEVFIEGEKQRCFSVNAHANSVSQSTVLTRIAPGAPIIASTEINVIDFVTLGESQDVMVSKTLTDGTKVIETSFEVRGDLPDDLEISLEFIVTDCLFENGDSQLELTAGHFDKVGKCPLRIYKASGFHGGLWTCHWVQAYPNDRLIPSDQ